MAGQKFSRGCLLMPKTLRKEKIKAGWRWENHHLSLSETNGPSLIEKFIHLNLRANILLFVLLCFSAFLFLSCFIVWKLLSVESTSLHPTWLFKIFEHTVNYFLIFFKLIIFLVWSFSFSLVLCR